MRDRTTQRTWEDFRGAVARVTEVSITVMPTNPGWAGQELFEPYIEEMGGERARITVRGEDLNLDSAPVEQARTHALERDYGELEVKGETSTGSAVKFDSEDPVPLIDSTVDRGESGEVPFEVLEDVLDRSEDLE